MSVELDVPDQRQHEKEKAGITVEGEGGANNDGREGVPPPRPRHFPAPISVHAPKPLSNSPVVTGKLGQRLNNKKNSLLFSSSSSTSPPPTIKERSSAPTISSQDRKTSKASNDDDDGNNHHEQQNNHGQQQQRSISAASLVVCGVDGTVYTLDAYTGQLRGMFASGPALVFSSSPATSADKGNDDDAENGARQGNYEHLNGDASNAITSNVSPGWKERVVPGLDGQLYSMLEMVDDTSVEVEKCQDGEYDEDHGARDSSDPGQSSSSSVIPRVGTYNLTPLPISAMDVVDSPISTCRPKDGDKQQEQCGIILGSKKTTIYAIDPTTGKVRWTQDPMGGAGGRGYTTHPPKNTASRGRTVLLQREDYAVRNLETDGGDEVWKVELGRFSALDFDVDSKSRRGSSRSGGGQGMNGRDDDDTWDEPDEDSIHVVGGRRRAAAAASVDSKEKKKSAGVPPILGDKKSFRHDHQHTGGGRKEGLFEHDEDDFDHDHSHFRGFPSIAFGEDGTSLLAVDGYSGQVLWKRRIESVVTAVYGVGKESSWIPLDVIDESDGLNPGSGGLLSSSSSPALSPHSGGLVPYGDGQLESGKVHRLGRHHSSLFVSSKFDPLGGHDSHPLADEPSLDSLPSPADSDFPLPPEVGGYDDHGLYPTEHRIFTGYPSDITMTDVNPPQSHRTEHGLYLSWSMVVAVVMILLALVIFIARVVILRQKRKWENTPSLDPTTAPSSSEDGRERSQSSGEILLPPTVAAAQNMNARSSGGLLWSKNLRQPAVTRSFSLDALGSSSLGSRGTNEARPFISQKNEAVLPLPALSATSVVQRLNLERGTSTPTAAATTGSPDKSDQQQLRPGVDNIDGIPLVRYSRYRSEFEEMSALGRGGFGTVFQCKNALDSREYAIKKIKIISHLGVDGAVTKQFSQKLHRVLREVKILALLDHPNIVRYYTAWLEVDDDLQNEDDETNTTSSILDKKSHSIFSSSLFSGFGSNSKAMQSKRSRPSKRFLGSYNPLGWNNFRSFRLEESQSEASSSFERTQKVDAPSLVSPCGEEEDLGFTWERSNEDVAEHQTLAEKQYSSSKLNDVTLKEEDDCKSSSEISSIDSEGSKDEKPKAATNSDAKKTVKLFEPNRGEEFSDEKKTTHILFIQMQLCSSQTLAHFLANPQARSGSVAQSLSKNTNFTVDIPLALRIFAQIAKGVRYVHQQGLIHRDLKPQNCFVDDAGNVKVGDFGLSRESATVGGITDIDESANGEFVDHDDSFAPPADRVDGENTAGVGTRAYASPEQMRGSNYDASTDVYSLGIILFELCYPMYTSMERAQEFGGIRKGIFPTYWNSHIKTSFPTMHDLLIQMISDSAAERPTADAVSDRMDSLLREYSVQSLDKSWGKKGALLLRVEAEEKEGVLANAMKLIKDAAPDSTILQYGLRSQANRAIMEFALEIDGDEKNASVDNISSRLHNHDMTVRQITNS